MTARHASSLRAALASHVPARGKRYSPALKARIIEFAQSRRSEGASWVEISGDIGVAFETLRRWCMATEPNWPGFRCDWTASLARAAPLPLLTRRTTAARRSSAAFSHDARRA
jgi:hypothetical protein